LAAAPLGSPVSGPNLRPARLSLPRIDDIDAQLREMTGIAGGEGCFARGGDTGDLHIADFN